MCVCVYVCVYVCVCVFVYVCVCVCVCVCGTNKRLLSSPRSGSSFGIGNRRTHGNKRTYLEARYAGDACAPRCRWRIRRCKQNLLELEDLGLSLTINRSFCSLELFSAFRRRCLAALSVDRLSVLLLKGFNAKCLA